MRTGNRLLSAAWLFGLPLLAMPAAAPIHGNTPGHSRSGRGATVRRHIRGVMRGKHLSVIVAPELQRAFARYFPGYELPIKDFQGEIEAWQLKEGLYFTCRGDFDGNGLPDVAVYLIEKRAHRVRRSRVPRRRWVFVAFHQMTPGTFQPHVIDRSWDPEFFSNEYLEGAPERITGFPMERKPRGSVFCYVIRDRDDDYGKMRLRHDGILQYSDDGEAENVFYFKHGKYHDVNIIDCD